MEDLDLLDDLNFNNPYSMDLADADSAAISTAKLFVSDVGALPQNHHQEMSPPDSDPESSTESTSPSNSGAGTRQSPSGTPPQQASIGPDSMTIDNLDDSSLDWNQETYIFGQQDSSKMHDASIMSDDVFNFSAFDSSSNTATNSQSSASITAAQTPSLPAQSTSHKRSRSQGAGLATACSSSPSAFYGNSITDPMTSMQWLHGQNVGFQAPSQFSLGLLPMAGIAVAPFPPQQQSPQQQSEQQKQLATKLQPTSSGRFPYNLVIHPAPSKSRVETQLNIVISMDRLPERVTKLHLPTHSISKPKLLSKPTHIPQPESLELYCMVVCTSVVKNADILRKVLLRAAASGHPDIRDPNTAFAESDENHPKNGGEVHICSGCIQRERKRAARKKNKSVEDDELWSTNETRRIVVFNTFEVIEWSKMEESEHQGRWQAVIPMRIACYCRHHGEKEGFRVIMTVKDHIGNVLAQTMTENIMITDDHKTHPVETSDPNKAALRAATRVRQTRLRQPGNSRKSISGPPAAKSRPRRGSDDKVDLKPAISEDPEEPSTKRRKSSGSPKLPMTMTMTPMETSQAQTQAQAQTQPQAHSQAHVQAQAQAQAQNPQAIFKYLDDDGEQLIRMALTILNHKMNGKMEDADSVARRFDRVVAGLLARGANPNTRDKAGYTPLHLAALNNHVEIVRRLIVNRADVMIESSTGYRAADLTSEEKISDVLSPQSQLRRSVSDLNLSIASSEDSIESLPRMLLTQGNSPSENPAEQSPEYSSFEDDEFYASSLNLDVNEADVEDGQCQISSNTVAATATRLNTRDLQGGSASTDSDGQERQAPDSPGVAAQLTAQLQQLQQTMAEHLPALMQFRNLTNLPNLPHLPNLPQIPGFPADYQAMRRLGQYLTLSGQRPEATGTAGDQQGSTRQNGPDAPPAYDEIFPGGDTKAPRSAEEAAARLALQINAKESRAATIASMEASKEQEGEIEEIPINADDEQDEIATNGKNSDVLTIGPKNAITKEQQMSFLRAYHAKNTGLGADRNLWLVWIPLLVLMIFAMFATTYPHIVGRLWASALDYFGVPQDNVLGTAVAAATSSQATPAAAAEAAAAGSVEKVKGSDAMGGSSQTDDRVVAVPDNLQHHAVGVVA
ncbi:Protein SPT23 [Ceratocystis platani]|uniref:Protein SPT23 n=1 Tax=Ceratocystis fimbriata f. sp. platani TaxID=88771 RepID=A0A0F8DL29_CERFI|nr:Protein SPT23 [Ceratocystis platani]